jgi:long-chain acyl-CoA synthetase
MQMNSDDVYVSYLPLPHVFERLFCCTIIYFGASIGFYGGDVLKLKDDLQVLRPTIFASVPRLYQKFYDSIKKGIDDLTGLKGYLAKSAFQSKMDQNNIDNSVSHSLYDKIIFSKTKAALGGRVRLAATGGAPISGNVLQYLKVTLCT